MFPNPVIAFADDNFIEDLERYSFDPSSQADPFHLSPVLKHSESASVSLLRGSASSWEWLVPFSRLETNPSRCKRMYLGSASYGKGLGGDRYMSDKELSSEAAEDIDAAPWMDEGSDCNSSLLNSDVYYK